MPDSGGNLQLSGKSPDTAPSMWIKLMKIGAFTGCHQRYDRSFVFKTYQFPLCARCTGLFIGYIFGMILPFVLNRFGTFQINILYYLAAVLLFASLLGIDGFRQLKGKWVSNNARRFVTGFLCGASVICFAVRLFVFVGGSILTTN